MISQAGILPTSLLGSHFFGKSSKHLEKKDLQRCYDFAHEKNARRKLLVYELTCNLLVNYEFPIFAKCSILDIWQGSEYASGVSR